jgi:hypothetical protein
MLRTGATILGWYVTSRATAQRALLGVVSVLCVAVVDGVVVSRLDAACGDWLAHPANSIAMSDIEMAASSHGSNSAPAPELGRATRPRSSRCHGPLCRKAPSQPAPPTPATISLQTDKLVLFGHVSLVQSVEQQLFYNGEPVAHAVRGFPMRIDHPPRA